MDKQRPVSPINGQPLPRGKPFTSESAREARQKRTKLESERRSIAGEFRKRMNEKFRDAEGNELTGAEIIAQSIIKGANNGNAKMVEIALALLGEKPAERIFVAEVQPDVIAEVESIVNGYDENTSS